MNKPDLKSALYIGGSLICEFVFKVLEISMFRNNNTQCDSAINEMLFYGTEDEEQTRQIELNNQLCIHYVILHASSTVDVCVPSLASDGLAKCLVSVQQKNKVSVRIAIHDSDDFHNLQLFAQSGVEVKVLRPRVRLAHEFVLLDAGARDALALLGALQHDAGPGAQHAGPGAQHAGPGAQHAGPGAQHAGPGAQHAGPGAQHAGPGARAATLLTSDAAVLAALRREFERVWNSLTDLPCDKHD